MDAGDRWDSASTTENGHERYVDDAVVHCVSKRQAYHVLAAISARMSEVGLALHPAKTKIVYCKDRSRRGDHEVVSFTFLGYTFRRQVHRWRLDRRTTETLVDLAEAINPIVRGWTNYWGHFYRSEMFPLLQRINTYLMRWARLKYKRLRGFKRLKAWWDRVVQRVPNLFAHWQWTTWTLPTGW